MDVVDDNNRESTNVDALQRPVSSSIDLVASDAPSTKIEFHDFIENPRIAQATADALEVGIPVPVIDQALQKVETAAESQQEKSPVIIEGMQPVYTDVPLPTEENTRPRVDCGVGAIEMLLLVDQPDVAEGYTFEKLRNEVGKEEKEYTMPGQIVRYLQEKGYQVQYHTSIDWQKCTSDNREDWDPLVQRLGYEMEIGLINPQKLQDSAKWLTEQEDVLQPNTEQFGLVDIAKALEEKKRVIALVEANHYVVVTGMDQEFVYYNDPNDITEKKKKPIDEFDSWWRGPFNWTDAIVAEYQKEDSASLERSVSI